MEETKKDCCCKKHLKCIVLGLILIFSITSTVMSCVVNYKIDKMSAPTIGKQKEKPSITRKYAKKHRYSEAKATGKPMLVLFYADWCGYCQNFAPKFDALIKQKDIKKNFAPAYVNAEFRKNADLVKEYGVEGFPTLFVVNGDKKVKIDNSVMFDESKDALKNAINDALKQ